MNIPEPGKDLAIARLKKMIKATTRQIAQMQKACAELEAELKVMEESIRRTEK